MTTPEPVPDREAVLCLRAFRAAIAVVLTFLLLTVFFSMPGNVLTSSWMGGLKSAFTITAPQGWAFFTKDPESVELYAYRSTPQGYQSRMRTPQVEPANLFGLSREQRAQGPEMAALARSATTWQPCTDNDFSQCMRKAFAQPAQEVANQSATPTVCGDIALVEEKPTPWAYRHFTSDISQVQDSAHIHVTCP
ncbi:SdpA family antimicrobial peptide system protein [Kitasatospora sp. NBC_01266]|uniref:SdpA family antimicrobial peptide system protein n=1 Tax=Kitasatospora sp. NBC_01266 TaxID=2903572 RepID=UPI002E3636AE|nr:SdpA family antimicrobial peptide system protein [Kitasatospora sp. NBC_01266]